jgi:hypothetical protein|tara:strand:- start:136 stop:408 length:273 start_codon:yes stop_codon:yes gene_type:complete
MCNANAHMTTLRDRLQELLDEDNDSDAETINTESDRSDEISVCTDNSFIDDDDAEYIPNTDDEGDEYVLCGVTLDGHGVIVDSNGLYSIK